MKLAISFAALSAAIAALDVYNHRFDYYTLALCWAAVAWLDSAYAWRRLGKTEVKLP